MNKLKYDDNISFYPKTHNTAVEAEDGTFMMHDKWEFTMEDDTVITKYIARKSPKYFWIENAYDGDNVIYVYINSSDLEFSLNPKGPWKKTSSNIRLNNLKDKVYLRGKCSKINKITSIHPFNIGGDLTTLLDPENSVLDLSNVPFIFSNLFSNSKIIDASELILPSVKISHSGYQSMFEGCTELKFPPKLIATKNIPQNGCARMFRNCISLLKAPKIIATEINPNCCNGMFQNCLALTIPPELPATTLATNCYAYMFKDCKSLIHTPELPATTLVSGCYQYMFDGCTSLSKITALFNDISASGCLYGWLYNIAPIGTFYYNPELPEEVLAQLPEGWKKEPARPNYFWIENIFEGENVLTLDSSYGMTNVEYTTDPMNSWNTVTFDTAKKNITIPQGGKIYLRGTNQTLGVIKNMKNSIISCSQQFNIGGDLTTLLVPEGNVLDLTGRDFVFMSLFINTTTLVDASELLLLPTTLCVGCYSFMFNNCTSLIKAPKLPSSNLQEVCYAYMFEKCTSLITAPALSAIILSKDCYEYMFKDCSLLTTAPELPATTLVKGCYKSMFEGCISLTVSPILPATKLAVWCYSSMFQGCSKLNKVTALFTNIESTSLNWWLGGVAPTGTFYHNSEITQEVLDAAEIPSDWTKTTYVSPVTK